MRLRTKGSKLCAAGMAVVIVLVAALIIAQPVPGQELTGGFLWIRQFGTPAIDSAYGIALDASGVYVAGGTNGTLPGQTNAGAFDAFLRKYDTNGNELWTRQFGTPSSDQARQGAIDASGVYVVGDTEGTLPSQTSAGGLDVFLRKYDTNGNELWTRQFGTPANDFGYTVAVSVSGMYVAGSTSGTLPGQTTAGSGDAFLRKYDTNGNELWTRQFGTPSLDFGLAVAVNVSGVYVIGHTIGTLPGQTSAGSNDVYVRKYDVDGNEVWTRQFGTPAIDNGDTAAADASGVYVAGTTGGTLPGQTSAGNFDAFLRKYDTNGNELWTRQFGTPGSDNGKVAVNASGVYVTGGTNGTLLGQTNAGASDAFLRKYDTNGNELWTLQFGTSVRDVSSAVIVDAFGLYIAGLTNGVLAPTGADGRDAFAARMAETPGPPLALKTLPADGRVELQWDAPAFDGRTSITDYRVHRGLDPGALNLLSVVDGSIRTYVDRAVTNDVTYYYQVNAVNTIGEGQASDEVSATPRGDVPPPPPFDFLTLVIIVAVAAAAAVAILVIRRRRQGPS